MPAPYTKKHFLEMSPREYEAWKEEQRQQELQRPGRDAVENVYPEEFIVPAARGLKAALTPRQPTRLEYIYNQPMPKEALELQKSFPPDIFEQASAALRKEMRDKQRMQEYFDKYTREKYAPQIREQIRKRQAEAPRKNAQRALTDVVTKTEYNNIFGPQEEYKRGGKVKARRGDGIAQRGRTKGRMI